MISSVKMDNLQMHQDLACLKHSWGMQQRAFMLLQSQSIAEERKKHS